MMTLESGRPAGFPSPEHSRLARLSPSMMPRVSGGAGSSSPLRALAYLGLSALACAASLAWILTAPNHRATVLDQGQALTAAAASQRLLMSGCGGLISLGLGIAGIYYWPRSGRTRARRHDPSLSTYDSVTGLPTQRLFLVLLGQALNRASGTRRIVAVLIVELSRFRPSSPAETMPNTSLVERVAAARIKSALQSHDAVARLGEQRFAVIIDNLNEATAALSIAEAIQDTISLPLIVEGHEYLLSCRIAGGVAPFDGSDGEALLDATAQLLADSQTDDASIKFLSDPSGMPSMLQVSSSAQRVEDTSHQASLTLPR